MFIKELFITLLEGSLLIILSLIGHYYFDDNCRKKEAKKRSENIKRTAKMNNFIIKDTNDMKKIL